MFCSIADSITGWLSDNHMINAEDREIYHYGIQQFFIITLNLLLSVIVGIAFQMVWQCGLFICSYIPLRSYAGGYHAKTQLRCYFLSVSLIMLSLMIVKYITYNFFVIVFIGFCVLGIFLLAPVENQNKPLSEKEVIRYRKKARWILVVEVICTGLFLSLKLVVVVKIMSAVWLLLFPVLVIGKVTKYFKGRHLVR